MFQDRRFALTTALALLCHGALLGTVVLLTRTETATTQAPPAQLVDVLVDATTEYTLSRTAARGADSGALPEPGSHPLPPTAAPRARAMNVRPRQGGPTAVGILDVTDSRGGIDVSAAAGSPDESQRAPNSEAATPGLGLERLGLGGPLAPTERSPLLRDAERRVAQSRKLERSLRQGAADDALQLGLGPSGPILAELERAAQSSAIPANGWATVHARLLDNGSLEMELLGSSSDRERWSQLLSNARQKLAAKKLSPPAGSRGIDLQILVESRVQLPSGADPGLGIEFLGVPLKRGEGKKSSRLEIASSLPRYEPDAGPKPSGEPNQPRIVWDIGKLVADPADIGAKRRRLVRATVTRQTVL